MVDSRHFKKSNNHHISTTIWLILIKYDTVIMVMHLGFPQSISR